MLLFFFANSDAVVADNLALNFLQEDIPEEAKFFYSYQLANENVHSETYALLIDNYIKDEGEKHKGFNAIFEIETVKKKMQFATQWISNGNFYEKLIAFAAVEGLLFSSTFCGIFGFKDLKKKLPGLYQANTFINRDEQSHYEFAVNYYMNHTNKPLDNNLVRDIILQAYEVEKTFVEDCFQDDVPGFSKDLMIQYIKYVTDTILIAFGQNEEFFVKQPYKYMEQIAIPRRTNFFETRSTEYTMLNTSQINIDFDF